MIVNKHAECGCHVDHGCSDHGFSRPEFFAGQLLTEDDLDALTSYVVGKNALHNRHFFGDGVVCGLDVQIDICKPRNVFVSPGHAIDCCGHDIIVPCEQSKVDVFKLLQELRTRLRGGYDCGDPCPEPSNAMDQSTAIRTYDLYVAYKEVAADNVAAYEGAGFSDGDCRPTRIRETYAFELRCPTKKSTRPVTINDRIRECLESNSLIAAARDVADSLQTLNDAHRMLTAFPSLQDMSKENLSELVRARASQLDADSKNAGDNSVDPALLRRLVAFGAILRFRGGEGTTGLVEELKKGLLGKRDVLIEKSAKSEGQSEEATRLIALYKDVSKDDQALNADDFDVKSLLMENRVTLGAVQSAIQKINIARMQLVNRAQDGGYALRTSTVNVPELTQPVSLGDVTSARENARRIGTIALDHYAKCFCEAFALPCESCSDTAVLIARLELDVKKCVVIDVCNIIKTFVLTHQRLRYLLPELEERIERYRSLCCVSSGDAQNQTTAISKDAGSARTSDVDFNSVLRQLETEIDYASGARLQTPPTHGDGSLLSSDVENALRLQVSDLMSKIKELETRVAAAPAIEESIEQRLQGISVLLPSEQKKFIEGWLGDRLSTEGLKQLTSDTGKDPNLAKVVFTEMKFNPSTEKVTSEFKPRNIDEFTAENDPGATFVGASTEDTDSLKAAWKTAAELKQLVKFWVDHGLPKNS